MQATNAEPQTAVLIIGAGPVGLGLAMELAYRNTPCILIEKSDGTVRHSKMGLLSIRTMEFCRRWGISDQVRACGFPADYPLNQVFCTSLNGHHISTIQYPSIADEPANELSPEKKQRCPQLWFDPILARNVKTRAGVSCLYKHELLDFEEDEHGVTAQVRNLTTGTISFLRARYLVGCDGAGSSVRKALGISLEGDAALSYSVGIYFTAPKLIQHHTMGPAERYMLVGEEGTWGHLTVVDASDIWRLTILGSQEKVESESFDADYWLQRCLGRKNIPYHIDAVLPWRRSRLVANRYRVGKVFLAGDACHIMAPNGGYGMNTGLGDIVDLGWKLSAVLQGWAPATLLDSYELERRPVAWRNVNAAAFNYNSLAPKLEFRHVEDSGPEGEAVRQKLQYDLAEGTRAEWEPHGINLGYRYSASPIIYDDGSPDTPDDMSIYVPTSRPGHRAPHVAIGPNLSTIDLFGKGFVLLVIDETESTLKACAPTALSDAATRSNIPLAAYRIGGAAATAAYPKRYTLVRPDGHVAWRADHLPSHPEALLRHVCGANSLADSAAPTSAIAGL